MQHGSESWYNLNLNGGGVVDWGQGVGLVIAVGLNLVQLKSNGGGRIVYSHARARITD